MGSKNADVPGDQGPGEMEEARGSRWILSSATRTRHRDLPDAAGQAGRVDTTPGSHFSSSALTCHTPKAADRLGLALNVGDKGRVVISLQPLLDEGPEDDSPNRILLLLLLRRAILESH